MLRLAVSAAIGLTPLALATPVIAGTIGTGITTVAYSGGGYGYGGSSFVAKGALSPTMVAGANGLSLNGNGEVIFSYVPTGPVSVPEPGTLALLGAGIAGLGVTARRRKRDLKS